MLLTSALSGKEIVLASGSPRRRELLSCIVPEFSVMVPNVEEHFPSSLRGKEIAEYLASVKADAIRYQLLENQIALTADTIVWVNDQVLNKPADAAEAQAMMRLLSGKTHEVITAFSLVSTQKKIVMSDTVTVKFRGLREEEIAFYVSNFAPYDKAGSYGIQEWIGYVGIPEIEGSFYTVMGLPVHLVYEALLSF